MENKKQTKPKKQHHMKVKQEDKLYEAEHPMHDVRSERAAYKAIKSTLVLSEEMKLIIWEQLQQIKQQPITKRSLSDIKELSSIILSLTNAQMNAVSKLQSSDSAIGKRNRLKSKNILKHELTKSIQDESPMYSNSDSVSLESLLKKMSN
jgi:hypothetical protein